MVREFTGDLGSWAQTTSRVCLRFSFCFPPRTAVMAGVFLISMDLVSVSDASSELTSRVTS